MPNRPISRIPGPASSRLLFSTEQMSEDLSPLALVGGTPGDDLLTGTAGNDTLKGGAGVDTMVGGAGDDTYEVGEAGDLVQEYAGGGNDLVNASVSYALSANVERLVLMGSANLTGTGNAGTNVLRGNSGANTLYGLGGTDTLYGGAGADSLDGGTGNDSLLGEADNDTLTGGDGNDTLDGGTGQDLMAGGSGNDLYRVDRADDGVKESAGGGIDTVVSSVSLTLGAELERLQLTGTGNLSGTGNALDNHLLGNSGANALNGGTGNDTMEGGAGNDTYTVDSKFDLVVEQADGGIDLVRAGVSTALAAHVEQLTLTGSATDGNGNSLDNLLTGNDANNRLTGLAGDDTLKGAGGADTLIGGTGNDSYYVDNTADVVQEAADEGSDTVLSTRTHTLASHVEHLTLLDTSNINGRGNASNNRLQGNAGINRLEGLDGDDTLDGGAGGDELIGGLGNDTYGVDSSDDWLQEAAGGGIDTVISSVSHVLGAEFEHLTLTGTGPLNGTGNAKDNRITGNSGNNLLTGDAGQDTLDAGGGQDTLRGGDGHDALLGLQWGEADGGAGTDRASIGTLTGATGVNNHAYVNGHYLTGSSGTSTINAALGLATPAQIVLVDGSNNRTLTLTGIETLDVQAGSAGNDLVLALGQASQAHGGAGTDTLYVDWRAVAADIHWNEGSGNGLQTSGFERWLLQLGTGDDTLIQSGTALTSEISTGAGNDSVRIDAGQVQAGDGSDQVSLLEGTVVGGGGSDTVTVRAGAGNVEVDGGTDLPAAAATPATDRLVVEQWQGTAGVNNHLYINGHYVTVSSSLNTIAGLSPALAHFQYVDGQSNRQLAFGGIEQFNVLQGSDGNDLLVALGEGSVLDGGDGTDTFYGDWAGASHDLHWTGDWINGTHATGFERLLLRTGSGNDQIDSTGSTGTSEVDTGAGDDTVHATGGSTWLGAGHDQIDLLSGQAAGQDGDDRFTVWVGYGSTTLDGGDGTDGVTITQLQGAAGVDNYLYVNGQYVPRSTSLETLNTLLQQGSQLVYVDGSTQQSLTLAGIEALSVQTGSAGNDLVIGLGSDGHYDGGAGTDTFYRDWSASPAAVNWYGASDGQITTQHFERFLLKTGAGDDTLAVMDMTGTSEADSGAGNDAVDSTGGRVWAGDGQDTVTLVGPDSPGWTGQGAEVWAGAGDDEVAVLTGHWPATVHGGDGTDHLTVAALSGSAGVDNYQIVNGHYAPVNIGFQALAEMVAAGSSHQWVDGASQKSLTLDGFERLDVLAGSAGNDLVTALGTGTTYDGGAGTDTFYADWAAAGSGVYWNGQSGHGVSTTGFERLLLRTGAGDDTLLGTGSTGTSDIWTGAGDDQITSTGGSIHAGSGWDRIVAGGGQIWGEGGTDWVRVTAGYSPITIEGGEGSDSVFIDQLAGAAGVDNHLFINGNYASVQVSLSSLLSFIGPQGGPIVFPRLYTFVNGADPQQQLTLNDVEGLEVSAGSAGNDLIFQMGGGTEYHGGAGTDTFHADWSGAGSAITWVNQPGAVSVINGVTLSGFERLLLLTGAGNDRIDNSAAPATADEFRTGAGHDTLNGGLGADTLVGGSGNDTYLVDNAYDSIQETQDGGQDTVQSSVSWTLGDHLETLVLTGNGHLNGGGNTLSNTLTGNAGHNVLSGGDGNDYLTGNAGSDTLHGGAGSDKFVLNSLVGSDVIMDFTSGVDKLRINQPALPVGNGNTSINGAVSIGAGTGFHASAELVLVTDTLAGSAIDAQAVAQRLGAALEAYAAGSTAVFVTHDHAQSGVWLFRSSGADATIDADELTLLSVLQNCTQTVITDYLFGA